ncbi:PaaI family thioesterase [Rhodococcus sp. 4CII]|uniref:PaaI family thioesterase n=1 Tax=Rhodococcus sp. 4CII TaxID=2834580 RepID=UPI00207906A5|nr:PaaI family thioesterase [Rhodococcus sp. 4CII]
MPAGTAMTSIDINVSYLRNILDTSGPLRGTGRVIKNGSRIVFAEAEIADKDGQLVATGTGTVLVIPPR